MTLRDLIKEKGSKAEAARFLEVEYKTFCRWVNHGVKPLRSNVKLAAEKGVEL